ncbi:MAG: sugar ABC transporter permease [Eubacterium sp.]|nr:sugar ABC transporter permease [Eubacterium sp.]
MKDVVRLYKKWNSIWQSKVWFLLPSVLGVGAFAILPFVQVLVRSFSGGLAGYRTVLENEAFHLAVKNTCRFVGVGIPLLLLLSFAAAFGIYKSRWMRLLKSIYLLPMAVPTAVVALIWKVFFHKAGLMNQLLALFHLEATDWLTSDAAFGVLIISYLWKNLGYTIVLWLAGMAGIPESITEAARVDGATEAQCVRYMILPQLKPVFFTITMLSFLNSFKVFREAYLVAGAYPQKSMYLLQHLFNNWFTNLEIDKMSSAAVLLAVFFAICSLGLQRMWEKEELS